MRFWEDLWLCRMPLATEYPSLYAIASNKNAMVADVFGSVPINLPFRRNSVGPNRAVWLNLVEKRCELIYRTNQTSLNGC